MKTGEDARGIQFEEWELGMELENCSEYVNSTEILGGDSGRKKLQ